MDFIDRIQCSTRLNFEPHSDWPQALPSISWKSDLIAGFNHSGPVIDISSSTNHQETHLEEAFFQCHPQLSLVELSRFYLLAQNLPIDWKVFFKNYQMHWNSALVLTVTPIPSLPQNFQEWATQKELHLKDFAILKSFKDHPYDLLHPTLLRISELNASKSIGSKIMEIAGELILMGVDLTSTLSSSSPEKWLQALSQLRYPMSAAQDKKRTDFFKTLAWPKGVEARGIRQGDQYALEVKLKVTNASDLDKKSKSLEGIAQHIQQSESSPWI